MTSCSYCRGIGSVEKSVEIGSGEWQHWVTIRETCGLCGGSGESRELALVEVYFEQSNMPRLIQALRVARSVIDERAERADATHPIQTDLVQITTLIKVLEKTQHSPADPVGTIQDFHANGTIEKRTP